MKDWLRYPRSLERQAFQVPGLQPIGHGSPGLVSLKNLLKTPTMTTLYHVTTQESLPAIAQDGLRKLSYWASESAVVDYYCKVVRDDGGTPVVLELPLEVLVAFSPEPDRPGLEEPISCAIGMGEDEVWEAWEATKQDWQACLELIGSLRCAAPIPAETLQAHNPSLAPARRKPAF